MRATADERLKEARHYIDYGCPTGFQLDRMIYVFGHILYHGDPLYDIEPMGAGCESTRANVMMSMIKRAVKKGGWVIKAWEDLQSKVEKACFWQKGKRSSETIALKRHERQAEACIKQAEQTHLGAWARIQHAAISLLERGKELSISSICKLAKSHHSTVKRFLASESFLLKNLMHLTCEKGGGDKAPPEEALQHRAEPKSLITEYINQSSILEETSKARDKDQHTVISKKEISAPVKPRQNSDRPMHPSYHKGASPGVNWTDIPQSLWPKSNGPKLGSRSFSPIASVLRS